MDKPQEEADFDINIFNNSSFGTEGDRTNAVYQVANQLRLRNYIELLKMRDRKNVIKKVIKLIEEMENE